jgi:integrating conjugative element protein (TIGR03765 family)
MKKIMLLAAIWVAVFAQAEPEVVADLGGRETGIRSPQEQLQEVANRTRIPSAITMPSMAERFPIVSGLRVGVQDVRSHSLMVTRPFFIVGFDKQSAQWLSANHAHLKEIHALGFVTNVNSPAQLDKLRTYAGDLTLNAIPVDELAERYQLTRYPVLVTQEKIIQ